MRIIKLNTTYITTFGKEFTPIIEEKQGLEILSRINQNGVFQNKETIYIDANGNRIKKSKLNHIKNEKPVIRPQGTI